MTVPVDESRKPLAAGLFGGQDACARAKPKAASSETARAFSQLFAASQDPGPHDPPLAGGGGRCFA